jgi:hypothetical protein
MMEPTVTQNSALYMVQHKIPKRHSGVLKRFSFAGNPRKRISLAAHSVANVKR